MNKPLTCVCKACGKRRSNQKLLYETTSTSLTPFCKNSFDCTRENLNHMEQIRLRRGETVSMVPYEMAELINKGKDLLRDQRSLSKDISHFLETYVW